MNSQEFDNCLKAYNEKGNDYRYTFTREQAADIKKALEQRELKEQDK